MHVRMIDPPAYTPPYDHALCAALAARRNEVELVTTRFRYGARPAPEGYSVNEHFYRLSGPLPVRAVQHPLDMLRLRRLPRPDVTHFQWLPLQTVDRRLLPPGPVVLTAHDVVPREPRPGQLSALAATYAKTDAVVVHSEHGRARLLDELDVPAERVHAIPHGVLDYLTRIKDPTPLPAELAAVEKPVVLCFGLLRPYKGIDLLIDAFAKIDSDAELWIVGMPRMPLEPLVEQARPLGDRVRFVPRFIVDSEIPAYFRRADLVVLPYREIDQSGVLFTALAFGSPILASRVGGFGEIADGHGALETVAPGDPEALARSLNALFSDPARRIRLGEAASALAAGEFSWASVAERTERLYAELLGR